MNIIADRWGLDTKGDNSSYCVAISHVRKLHQVRVSRSDLL